VKEFPSKLGKKIKRQFHRFTSFHHVTSTTEHSALYEAFPVVTSISISPLFHPTNNIARASFPRSRRTTSSATAYSTDSFTNGKASDFGQHSDKTSSEESLSYFEKLPVSSKSPMDIKAHTVPTAPASAGTPAVAMEVELAQSSVEGDNVQNVHATQPAVDAAQAEASESQPTVSDEETLFFNPPVQAEPYVPDPFFMDDVASSEEGDEDDQMPAVSQSQSTITTQDVSLTHPTSPLAEHATPHTVSLPSPNVDKAIPPPPSSDTTDEDEAPDLYLSGLLMPTLFLPIPNVRRSFSSNYLTWWLSRSIMYHTCNRRIR
jgi:hypothetical protein